MEKLARKDIPTKPGVYFFRKKNRKVLYIGKASNLKNRIGSYFSSRPNDSRIKRMLDQAEKVDWQETNSEIEALIVESQLIKKNRPPFNITLRDDKQYFFVVFTKEDFPKILITHQPKKYDEYIGPFTDGGALRASLKLFRKIFPYCSCKQRHNNYCLNYHIGKCQGFCCLKKGGGKEEKEVYKDNIKAIKNVLSGKRVMLVKRLEKEMSEKAKEENFEKAIQIRTQLEKLKNVFENAKIIHEIFGREKILIGLQKALSLPRLPRRIEGYDISNIQGLFATGSMVVFTDGRMDKNEYRKFKIRAANTPNDVAMLKEVITRRFRHGEWIYPDLILIDGGKPQLNTALSILSSVKTDIPVVALTKNDRHKGDHVYVQTVKNKILLKDISDSAKNLLLQIDSEAHRFAISYYRKLHKRGK